MATQPGLETLPTVLERWLTATVTSTSHGFGAGVNLATAIITSTSAI